MGTTINDLIDRHGADRGAWGLEETLDGARRLFADLTAFLELEIEELGKTDTEALTEARMRSVTDLIRMSQKALTVVLEIKSKLARDLGASREDMLDLDAARDEIARRLARLEA